MKYSAEEKREARCADFAVVHSQTALVYMF